MCKTTKKIEGFSALLNLLRRYFRSVDGFNQLFVYKTQYLLCVESVSAEVGGNTNMGSLFGLFDNFRALRNGPVEWDIYTNRDIIPGWKYDSDKACFCFESESDDIKPQSFEEEEWTLFDESFSRIAEKLFSSLGYDPNDNQTIGKLIDLTHELKLWKYTFEKYGEKERLLTKNANNRRLEYNAFNEWLENDRNSEYN